jgi:hypothetical protein
MMTIKYFLLSVVFLVIFPLMVLGQQADSLRNNRAQTQTTGDIIELGVTEIKIKAEAPQVKLFNARIKPEFDNVNLEKSFQKEIVGEGEQLIFQEIKSNDAAEEMIDVNKMLTKLR